LTGRLLSKSSQ